MDYLQALHDSCVLNLSDETIQHILNGAWDQVLTVCDRPGCCGQDCFVPCIAVNKAIDEWNQLHPNNPIPRIDPCP